MFGPDGEDLTESVRDWVGLEMMLTGAKIIGSNAERKLLVTDQGTIFDFGLEAMPGKATATDYWVNGAFDDRVIRGIDLEHSTLLTGSLTSFFLRLGPRVKTGISYEQNICIIVYNSVGKTERLYKNRFAEHVKFTPGMRLLWLAEKDAMNNAY